PDLAEYSLLHTSLPPSSPHATRNSPRSLHDALPIYDHQDPYGDPHGDVGPRAGAGPGPLSRPDRGRAAVRDRLRSAVPTLVGHPDRKSTRLNSSHVKISYAVFCLKKKISPRPKNCIL